MSRSLLTFLYPFRIEFNSHIDSALLAKFSLFIAVPIILSIRERHLEEAVQEFDWDLVEEFLTDE